jgi:hypothetical protein
MSESRQEFRAVINDGVSYLVALTAVTNSEFDILTIYEPDKSMHGSQLVLDYYQCMGDFMKETGAAFIKDETPDHEHAHSADKGEDDVNHSHLKLPKNYINTEKFQQFLDKLESCGGTHTLTSRSGIVLSPLAVSYTARAFEECQFGISTSDCFTSIGSPHMRTIAETKQIRQSPARIIFSSPRIATPQSYVTTSTQFTARNIGTDLLYGSFLLAGVLACTLFGRCLRSRHAKVEREKTTDQTHQPTR